MHSISPSLEAIASGNSIPTDVEAGTGTAPTKTATTTTSSQGEQQQKESELVPEIGSTHTGKLDTTEGSPQASSTPKTLRNVLSSETHDQDDDDETDADADVLLLATAYGVKTYKK